MSARQFEVLDTLGKGSFCVAYKVRRLNDQKVYAMKKFKLRNASEEEVTNSLNEVRILASVSHPNVVAYKEAFVEHNYLHTIMEFCESGDLAHLIHLHQQKGTYVPENEIWQVLTQIARGLRALHQLSIVHRDIKSANIFVAAKGIYKIGDMNISSVAKDGWVYTHAGTPYYASPEVWNECPCDYKSDIWSLGCVIYELAALQPPFTGDSLEEIFEKVTEGLYAPIPEVYSSELSNMIGLLLRLNPNSRPTTDILLDYPVIKERTQQIVEAKNKLLDTIKFPRNLSTLKKVLPKPKYHLDQLPLPEKFEPQETTFRPLLQRMLTDIRDNKKSTRKYAEQSQNPHLVEWYSSSKRTGVKRRTIAAKIQELKDYYIFSPRAQSKKRF